AIFIIKIDGAFSTTSFSNVVLINGASACNVYWQINGAVALGDSSAFRGTIIAEGAISLATGAMLEGRGLSTAGAISTNSNIVTLNPSCNALAPSFVCPDDITVSCVNEIPPSDTVISSTDNCGALTLTSADVISNMVCANGLTVTRTYVATDDCGNSASCMQIITVNDTIPPSITCPGDLFLECTDSIPTDLATASDNCGDSVTLSYTDMVCNNPVMGFTGVYDFSNWTITIPPQGGSVTPMGDMEVMLVSPNNSSCFNASAMISIVVPATGQIVFDWSYNTVDIDGPAFDPFGYSINGLFVRLTDNQGPDSQSGTVSIAVNAGDVFAFEQRSTDCIFGSGATSVVEFFACVPGDAETCSQLIIRTHTATDDCGNTSSCIQTILIEDTTPPDITCPPDTTFFVLDSTLLDSAGMATATDSCSSVDSIYFEDEIIESECDSSFVVNRTWTAVDACGNSSTCLQIIEMLPEDTTTFVGEAIACLDHINLSIDNDCGTVLMSGMILTGDLAGDNTFTVIIKDQNGNIIPDATFTYEHVGQTFTVMVVNECSGQSCWGYVTVEDKLGPIIDCVCPVGNEGDSCIISCLQIADFLEGNIPPELRPTVVDNCGGATIEISNIELNYEVCSGGFFIVSWLATDAFGNTSTCQQEFFIEPLTLDSLVFPPDFTGDCDQSSDPDVTGWPQVDGMDLSNIPGHCNILATYTDSEHPMCG
ncbi:MAG: ice-binding family protein, partial [Saprospiraceae bacterium]